MPCIQPPALSDDEIAAAVQGDASDRVMEHLQRCAFCAARFNEAKAFENRLSAALYRLDCPDEEQLTGFVADRLSAPAERTVRDHLETCLLCRSEVEFLRPMFETQVPSPSAVINDILEDARAAVNSLLVVLTLQPSPAVRSRNPLDVHKRQFLASDAEEKVSLLIDLNRGARGILLSGQLILKDQRAAIDGALLELSQNQAVIAAVRVNDEGEFSTGELAPGIYDLKFTLMDSSQVVLPSIDLSLLPD